MDALKKRLKKHRKIVFLDFEGTQFSHEVIAIGAYKCDIDQNGNIIKEDETGGFKRYVKAYHQIGHIITNLTSLTDDFIKEQGISFDQALEDFKTYVDDDFNNVSFIVFGSNDAKMLIESKKYSKPKNDEIVNQILSNIFDFLAFISQYIRDENNNTFSLVNYLNLFNVEPIGKSHDPLNDAIDLKNLYIAFRKEKKIIQTEYKKLLLRNKIFPSPIKTIINKLVNGEDISHEEFNELIRKYLD